MQINNYAQTNSSYHPFYKSDNMQKTNTEQSTLSKKVEKSKETGKTSSVGEMEAFKREIYEELDQIRKLESPRVLSQSVHITEDAFKRMKEEPEYRKKAMDWIRLNARDSHKLNSTPLCTHSTTTITSSDIRAYSVGVHANESTKSKVSKEREADRRSVGAFYRHKRKSSYGLLEKDRYLSRIKKLSFEKSQGSNIRSKALSGDAYLSGLETQFGFGFEA